MSSNVGLPVETKCMSQVTTNNAGMMGGDSSRRQQRLNPQRQINSISYVKQVKASSHKVCRYGAPCTVAMNEGDTNAYTGSSGMKWVILQSTNDMADLFGLKLVKDKPNSELVQIGTFGAVYDCTRNQKTYILFQN